MNPRVHRDGARDFVLQLCKRLGLFRLARFVTRRGVRILCYHAFAQLDEVEFRPSLFMTLGTFESRLKLLADEGYSVVPLRQAVAQLEQNNVAPDTVVITVDDVFHNFQTDVMPLIEKYSIPATAYVTTYYSVKRAPVFRLVVRYVFWKTRCASIDLSEVGANLTGQRELESVRGRQQAEEQVISAGEVLPAEEGRQELLHRLALELDVDLTDINTLRVFHIVTPEQIADLSERGADIQLHTHRHRFPEENAAASREIEDNRAVLKPVVGVPLLHFCYPSGIWSPRVWPTLEAAGIKSATTCDPGLNFHGTHRFALRRILDAESVTAISLEAELSGFKYLLRRAFAWRADAVSDRA